MPPAGSLSASLPLQLFKPAGAWTKRLEDHNAQGKLKILTCKISEPVEGREWGEGQAGPMKTSSKAHIPLRKADSPPKKPHGTPTLFLAALRLWGESQ